MNKLHKDITNIVYQYVYRDTFNDVMKELSDCISDIYFLFDYNIKWERKTFKCERCMKNWTFKRITFEQICSECILGNNDLNE